MISKIKKLKLFLKSEGFDLESKEINKLLKISAPDGLYPTKEDLWRSKYYDEVWTTDKDRKISEIRSNSSKILAKKAKQIILDSKDNLIDIRNNLETNKKEISKKLSDEIKHKKDSIREQIETYKNVTNKADKYFEKTDQRKKLDEGIENLSKNIDNIENKINPKINEIEKKYFRSSNINLNNTDTIIDFLINTIDKILKNLNLLAEKTEEFLLTVPLDSNLRMSLSEAIYYYERAENESGIFYISTFFHSLLTLIEGAIQVMDHPREDKKEIDILFMEIVRAYKEILRLLENLAEPLSYIIPTFGD